MVLKFSTFTCFLLAIASTEANNDWSHKCSEHGVSQPFYFTDVTDECTNDPPSLNGNKFPSGCAGAVWSDGEPSQSYCEGNNGKHPWYAKCCKFEINECVPNRPKDIKKRTCARSHCYEFEGSSRCVQYFRESRFRGVKKYLDPGDFPTFSVDINDRTSSLKVAYGCEVTFYQRSNFGGKQWKYKTGEYPWVGNGANDRFSSAKVTFFEPADSVDACQNLCLEDSLCTGFWWGDNKCQVIRKNDPFAAWLPRRNQQNLGPNICGFCGDFNVEAPPQVNDVFAASSLDDVAPSPDYYVQAYSPQAAKKSSDLFLEVTQGVIGGNVPFGIGNVFNAFINWFKTDTEPKTFTLDLSDTFEDFETYLSEKISQRNFKDDFASMKRKSDDFTKFLNEALDSQTIQAYDDKVQNAHNERTDLFAKFDTEHITSPQEQPLFDYAFFSTQYLANLGPKFFLVDKLYAIEYARLIEDQPNACKDYLRELGNAAKNAKYISDLLRKYAFRAVQNRLSWIKLDPNKKCTWGGNVPHDRGGVLYDGCQRTSKWEIESKFQIIDQLLKNKVVIEGGHKETFYSGTCMSSVQEKYRWLLQNGGGPVADVGKMNKMLTYYQEDVLKPVVVTFFKTFVDTYDEYAREEIKMINNITQYFQDQNECNIFDYTQAPYPQPSTNWELNTVSAIPPPVYDFESDSTTSTTKPVVEISSSSSFCYVPVIACVVMFWCGASIVQSV
jgi:hypothetical protein